MTNLNPGTGPTIVEPGSADDPFTALNSSSSNGAPGVRQVDETVQPTVIAPTIQPASAPASAAPAAPAPKAEEAVKEAPQVDVAAIAAAEVQKALRSQQAGYDRRITELQESLKSAREAAIKAERESKLSSEDLTDDEKDVLRSKFALDDMKADLEQREAANEEYFRAIYIAKLVGENEKFGVTPEMLEALEEPEEMELLALRMENEYHRSGKGLTLAEALAKPEPEPTAKVPAGATAPSDLGGTGAEAPAPKLSTGTGRDAMIESLNAIPLTTVTFN